MLSERLREKGYVVFIIPEAASMIFSSGGIIKLDKFTEDMQVKFQYLLMMLQMSLEDIMLGLACNSSDGDIVLLCDRGTMDGSAYISKKLWNSLLTEYDLNLTKIRDRRYDLVVHISSAANGAE